MMFGEIIEPSTRALILDEDELEELPEYKEPVFEWEGDPNPPDDIEKLIFADSKKVIQICSKITKGIQPVARLKNEGLSIYKFQKSYLGVFDGSKNLVIGEIIELLSPWIQKAKSVHCITSTLLSTFQPWESLTDASTITFTRCLTNHEVVPYNFCKPLETPNLIQGFGAGVLSYCIHNSYKTSLWVVYTDNMPVDSVNCAEIIRVFKILGLEVKVDFKVDTLSSNLYM